jgi:hypothetical protein
VAVEDGLQGLSDVGDRVDVVELASCHDGGQQRPVLGTDLMACEQRILAVMQRSA